MKNEPTESGIGAARLRSEPHSLLGSLLSGALILGLAPAQPLQAQDAYRWTDASGQVHFTDTPPPAGASSAREIHVDVTDQPSSSGEDYSINAQVQRLKADRKAREAERLEAQKRDQEKRIQELERQVEDAKAETARVNAEQEHTPVYVYPPYPYPGPVPPIRPPHPVPPPPTPEPPTEDTGGSLGSWHRAPQRGGK